MILGHHSSINKNNERGVEVSRVREMVVDLIIVVRTIVVVRLPESIRILAAFLVTGRNGKDDMRSFCILFSPFLSIVLGFVAGARSTP
jgi:hypothetical protein